MTQTQCSDKEVHCTCTNALDGSSGQQHIHAGRETAANRTQHEDEDAALLNERATEHIAVNTLRMPKEFLV
jgi:hypothetical protein